MKTKELKAIVERAQTWPKEAQAELAQVAEEIEQELGTGAYHATPQELSAIDEADRSGVATEGEVEAAFAKFRGA